jgi:hypothetical protein
MMDDQKILDNAPKCNTATHVDNEGDYYKIQVEYQYEDESDCGYEQMFKLNHLKNWEVDDCVLILMRSLADIKELVELRKANAELEKVISGLRKSELENDALVMANARRLIKANVRTSNGRLYSEIFGTGCGSGRQGSRNLRLDPDGNKTCYSAMCSYIDEALKAGN